MKNADLPAMPTEDIDTVTEYDTAGGRYIKSHGLTKHEDFVKTFISASISSGNTYKGFIDDAIMWAEEALAKLDETKS